MKRANYFLIFIALLSFFSCTKETSNAVPVSNFQNEKTELIASGPYPDYYYNLANELRNTGRTEKAMEAYKNCIATSKSQTFIEDAMFNLSLLYFESQQDSMAYTLMDSLIAKKYTWLGWYKNSDHLYRNKARYTHRLTKIDSVIALRNDPANSKFYYEDVSNFVNAFEKSRLDWAKAPSYFYDDYFSKASKGLFFFQKFKIESSAHQFSYRVEDKKQYFEAILPNLQKLKLQESTIRNYLDTFEELYPEAVFPDIYYLVGCFNAGGTSTPLGLLIGTEMHSKTDDASLVNFSNWEKKVVRNFSNLPLITIHELVHIQQQKGYNNLLGNSIYEGAADFISELICGSHINQYVHDWADKKEFEIWTDFKSEMYGSNSNNWIGNADRAKDKPADLGYYVGYKICESYYNRQVDKTKAMRDILSITDWNNFYLQSGYMQ